MIILRGVLLGLGFGIAAALLLGSLVRAEEARPEQPVAEITCDQVRAFVAQNGRRRALALALKNGATLAQIREAIKCLK